MKSVKIHTGTSPGDRSSYSAFENDPFTPAPFTKPTTSLPANGSQVSKAPEFPTSNSSLVEVPTCTICLDRMDESSGGVLIIPCQHAYHCDCYQQWRKSGCPVCRYTENDLSSQNAPEGPEGKCNDCNTDKDLWVCTICGNVGCGRSDPTKAHSMNHWKENPAHRFAMSLSNQSIWDYEDDKFVDRLLLKEDKFVDHPASSRPPFAVAAYGGDSVLLQQARLEIAHEYTVRLSEQLAETRRHWEEKVESTKHAAKMAKEKVTRELKERSREAKDLRTKYENLRAENKEMVKQYNAKIQQAQLNSEEKLRQSRMQSEKKTKQLEKQNSSLAQELETFKLLCEESQRKSERLLQELEEYKASSASLQEQAAAEASRELKASNEKVETVEKEKNELKKEVEKLRRDAALSATQAVASTKDYIKELKQKLREAETKAKEESAFSSQITENLKLMRREKQAAEEQRDGAVNRVKGMEKELQGKDAAIRGKETERLKAIQLAESYQQELQEAYMNLAKAMEVNSSMVEGTLKPEDAKGASLSVGQGSAAPQSPPTPVLQPAEPVQQKKETRAERRAREREEKKKAGGN